MQSKRPSQLAVAVAMLAAAGVVHAQVYVRKVDGKLYNVEFDKFADQKDPGK
jgi:hypothetical protein